MARNFLPTEDGALLTWSNHFTARVAVNPVGYGLTAEQSAAVADLVAEYAAVYQTANDAKTRSPENIQIKNTVRDNLVAEIRRLVKIAQAAPVMNDDKRAALQITIPDSDPTPSTKPAIYPGIEVTGVRGNAVSFRLFDPANATRRAKPEGIAGATLLSYVGDAPPSDEGAWKFEGNTTRTSSIIELPNTVTPGAKVWITAFWFNRTAQSGPAADPVFTHTQFGGLSQAA